MVKADPTKQTLNPSFGIPSLGSDHENCRENQPDMARSPSASANGSR
jgi:hypothetical protein